MNYLQKFEQMTATQQQEFTRILNKLLSVTFISRKKENNRKDYYFIERNQQLFQEYLKIAGWTLVADKAVGVFQVVNEYGYNRMQLKLEESIIILIIRLCYEEKRQEISMNDQVMIKIREIQDKYSALKIRENPIAKTSLRSILSLLKRFNIIDNLDRSLVDPHTRLLIYPSILLAIKVDAIRQIYDKLKNYSREDEIDLTEENLQIAEGTIAAGTDELDHDNLQGEIVENNDKEESVKGVGSC